MYDFDKETLKRLNLNIEKFIVFVSNNHEHSNKNNDEIKMCLLNNQQSINKLLVSKNIANTDIKELASNYIVVAKLMIDSIQLLVDMEMNNKLKMFEDLFEDLKGGMN